MADISPEDEEETRVSILQAILDYEGGLVLERQDGAGAALERLRSARVGDRARRDQHAVPWRTCGYAA